MSEAKLVGGRQGVYNPLSKDHAKQISRLMRPGRPVGGGRADSPGSGVCLVGARCGVCPFCDPDAGLSESELSELDAYDEMLMNPRGINYCPECDLDDCAAPGGHGR